MKFVIPAAEDESGAEHLYDSIKKFAVLQTRLRLTERRVFSIEYFVDGIRYFAEVGKTHAELGEQVFAILEAESRSYLLCSPNRCVYRNEPMLVESRSIRRVTYFEDETQLETVELKTLLIQAAD
jgi:hypothetical protein